MYDAPKFLMSGDSCLAVEFSDEIEIGANIRLQNLRRALAAKNIRGVREFVPTYRSLYIHHDPLVLPRDTLKDITARALENLSGEGAAESRILLMPVSYGGEFGPDIENVSLRTGLGVSDIIERHTARDYYCYMLGFTPGFGYLGGMDESLAVPRLREPRTLIPAGSVGIAGKQTGAYSIDSPGGWQLIGRTPLKLFDPEDETNPTLLNPGDWIRFQSVSRGEYDAIKKDIDAGKYKVIYR
ncbi:allophanate hydrolase [Synergistales bacterium]|nr:allophanate hydrolase [Synergistales bacterium]